MFNLEKLFIDVFNPQKGETVLLMSDIPHNGIKSNNDWVQRLKMVEEWQECFKKLGKRIGFKVYSLLFYPATGVPSASLPKYGEMEREKVLIENILKNTNICLALTEYSATAPLMTFAKKFNSLRIAIMPGVSKAMEKTALAADYKEIARKCSVLKPKLTRAVGASVGFSTGDEFYFDLRNRVAGEDNGMCHKNKRDSEWPGINLPSGEVFIVPYEGEDKEDTQSKTQGFLPVKYGKELVLYKVQENKIIKVIGKGPEAKKKKKYFAEDKGRRNIAELGLGLNDKAIIRGIVLEDEKVGFHWAYGLSEHLGGKTGLSDFENSGNAVHQDIVYAKGSPIEVKRLVFEYPNGSHEFIVQNGDYVIFKK